MTEADAEKEKYKFDDPQDQQKYEEWLKKIQLRFMDPEKITDNYCVKLTYMSTTDAEVFLIHEIAHMIEHAWMVKTKTRTGNSNPELFSLYIETIFDYSKALRLWEIYRILVSTCLADLLVKKQNVTDMRQSLQSLEALRLYDYDEVSEQYANCSDELIKEEFQHREYTDLSNHIYALYNAIKLHEQKLSIPEVLRKISTEQPAKLTPQNFHELMDYLMK